MTGADSKPCGNFFHAALINRAPMDQPHCARERTRRCIRVPASRGILAGSTRPSCARP
jgi:hypothetical protein